MIELAFVVAAGSLASGLVLAYLLRRAPTVGVQLAGLALIAVCVPLAAVLLSGWVMFHMGADLKILAVAAGSATAAVVAALLLARSITASLRRVGAASHALAAGELSARAPVVGAREIAELAGSFNAMAAGLEQLFDARRELVAWASHDLRAPIASLQAMLEAIEDGLASAEDYLPTLREQTRALSALVDDLFELARIDAGALTLELRRMPIAPLVASALRMLQPEAEARGVALSAEVDEQVEAELAPESSSASSSTSSRTRCAIRRPTARSQFGSSGAPPTCCCASKTVAKGWRERPRLGCSNASGAPTVRAAAAERAWDLRLPAASSRRTAAGSGPRTALRAAPASRSRCRLGSR
jgi:signal transduction histidine kinase